MSFTSEINKLVWNVHIEPQEFESRWNELMDIYSLRGDSWWDEIYNIRESWIPAYYKEFAISGLIKTTSRLESITAFFHVYAKFVDDLVFFINQFDHAIEDQRKAHCELEVETRTTIPRMLSPSFIEAQACEVYTRTIFLEVQKELNKAVWFCTLKCDEDGEDVKVYEVNHMNKKSQVKTTYTVISTLFYGFVLSFILSYYLCFMFLCILIFFWFDGVGSAQHS